MQKAPNMEKVYSLAAAQATKPLVEVPVYQMPKTHDGRQRFPTRSDGAEAAVMGGAVATVKIRLG